VVSRELFIWARLRMRAVKFVRIGLRFHAGAGTGGASATVNETFSVSDAVDTVASWLEPEGSSKAKADPQPPKGTPPAIKTPPKPPDPKSTRSR
jgi:hypothetical protein